MKKTGLKVLVAEDEESLRDAIARILRKSGYDLLEAATGREALDIFLRQRPDIVVTDIRMPEMSGLELLRAIKKESPETSVAVMTGFGSEEIAVQAIRSGACNYFKKPFKKADFVYAMGVMSNLILSQRAREFNFDFLQRETRTVGFGNNLENVYSIINELTRSIGHLSFDVESIRIGLLEMVINAVEHGNLNISAEEKQQALQKGNYMSLFRERAGMTVCRERTVRVDYEFLPEKITYTITDEGDGFDWRDLPDPNNPSNLLKATGRGIILTKLLMDDVYFNEAGNCVTIVKTSGSRSPARP